MRKFRRIVALTGLLAVLGIGLLHGVETNASAPRPARAVSQQLDDIEWPVVGP